MSNSIKSSSSTRPPSPRPRQRKDADRRSNCASPVEIDVRQALVEALLSADDRRIKTVLALPGAPDALPTLADSLGRPTLCLLVENGAFLSVFATVLDHVTALGESFVDRCMPGTGQTALHLAAAKGYQVCIEQLIAAGADPEAADASGNTALMLSCRRGHQDAARALLDLGVDPNAANSANGETALHASARYGHGECVRLLMTETDCDTNATDHFGRTPLMLAVMENQTEVAELILDTDSAHQAISCEDRQTGKTILHWAVYHGMISTIMRLIKLGADVNVRDVEWNTPFLVAVRHERSDVIPLLVQSGCDINATDRSFTTALHLAAKLGQSDLLPLLVSQPPFTASSALDVNLKSSAGLTALMIAARGGHVQTVLELLRLGADPNVVDRHRANALVHAMLTPSSDEPDPAIVKALIRYNCDVDTSANLLALCQHLGLPLSFLRVKALDDRLYAPVELACLRGQISTFCLLVHAGCDQSKLLAVRLPNIDSYAAFVDESAAAVSDAMQSIQSSRPLVWTCRKKMSSLKTLCRRPVLSRLLAIARPERLTISDVIARTAGFCPCVREMLEFEGLEYCCTSEPVNQARCCVGVFLSPENWSSPVAKQTMPTRQKQQQPQRRGGESRVHGSTPVDDSQPTTETLDLSTVAANLLELMPAKPSAATVMHAFQPPTKIPEPKTHGIRVPV